MIELIKVGRPIIIVSNTLLGVWILDCKRSKLQVLADSSLGRTDSHLRPAVLLTPQVILALDVGPLPFPGNKRFSIIFLLLL